MASQVSKDLRDLASVDAGVLGQPHPTQNVLGVEIGMELLHLLGAHQVALHPRGPVAAGPPLERDHAVPRGGDVDTATVLYAQIKPLFLKDNNCA